MKKANILVSKPLIKINASLIGYGLWIIFSQYQITTIQVKVPVCFYKLDDRQTISAPDTIDLTLSAQRKTLHHFDAYNSAVHLDASHLESGNNHISITKDNLFLPDQIKLVNLVPSHIQVHLQKKV